MTVTVLRRVKSHGRVIACFVSALLVAVIIRGQWGIYSYVLESGFLLDGLWKSDQTVLKLTLSEFEIQKGNLTENGAVQITLKQDRMLQEKQAEYVAELSFLYHSEE